MAQELNELLPNKRPLDVVICEGKEPLRISYRPETVTQDHLERLESTPNENSFEIIALTLEMFGVEWDVTKDGEAVPATLEGFRKVNRFLLPIIMNAVVADSRPKEATSESLENTSQPTDNSEPVPTGT